MAKEDKNVGNELSTQNDDYVIDESSSEAHHKTNLNDAVTKVKALNPAVALLGLIVIIALMVIIFVTMANNEEQPGFNTTELSEEEQQQLSADQANIETSGQRLTIGPNTDFNNDVTVERSLEVIGDLSVAGNIDIPQLDLGGSQLNLENAQIDQNLLVSGNATVEGGLSVNSGATVDGTFTAGSISTGSLNLSGDLTITRHISAQAPGVSGSQGNALGSGGTASVSGDDISGTVNINTGNSAPAGRLYTVNFRIEYGETPQVIITPVGAGSAQVNYYIERSVNGFSIHSSGDTPDNTNMQFDYFVIE